MLLDDEREFKLKPDNLTLGIRTRSGSDVRAVSTNSTDASEAWSESMKDFAGRRSDAADRGASARPSGTRRLSWADNDRDRTLAEEKEEQESRTYTDSIRWQGWLKVSRCDLLQYANAPFRTRYVVVTDISMVHWKGPSETMAEMYHDHKNCKGQSEGSAE